MRTKNMKVLRYHLNVDIQDNGPTLWYTWEFAYRVLENPEPLNWVKGGKRTAPSLYHKTLSREECEKLLKEKGWVYSPWREDPLWGDLARAADINLNP